MLSNYLFPFVISYGTRVLVILEILKRLFYCLYSNELPCCMLETIHIREHPFNLKRGVLWSKYLFPLRSAAEFLSRHYFFSTKTIFLKHKVLTEYFCLLISETKTFFNQICRQKFFSQKKNSPPPLQVK